MLKAIHAQITRQALEAYFAPQPLEVIVTANLAQDDLRGQIGHDEYHFDNNALARGRDYLEEQRAAVLDALRDGRSLFAWQAFGRLTHGAQDFYAHSNYVRLWISRYQDAALPPPPEIDPVDSALIHSPELRSGKLYYPLEVLYFFPLTRRLSLALLPRDSHAHMNLDSAEQGDLFPYAFHAAFKRTRLEFERLQSLLPSALLRQFTRKE
jgi:hypothetical protein